jgi:hypothetical protein
MTVIVSGAVFDAQAGQVFIGWAEFDALAARTVIVAQIEFDTGATPGAGTANTVSPFAASFRILPRRRGVTIHLSQ